MTDDRLPTPEEALRLAANIRAWIWHSNAIQPVVDFVYPPGTPGRGAWDAAYATIPRFEGFIQTLEADPSAPIVGERFKEFSELAATIARTAAVSSEHTDPTDVVVKKMRNTVDSKFPAGTQARHDLDLTLDRILEAPTKEAQIQCWGQFLTAALLHGLVATAPHASE